MDLIVVAARMIPDMVQLNRKPGRRIAAAVLLASLGLTVASCSDSDVTNSTDACAARLYTPFDRKNMNQCVNVCMQCENGTKVTCSTSCTLKGAK
jgi:hypothetical protein